MAKTRAKRLERLERFLLSLDAGDDAMLLSELDGFIAGIAVCPELIMPSEWLPVVWGTDGPVFQTEEEAQEALDLIMHHYNAVLRSLGKPGGYTPILDEDRDGSLMWELWASGFRKAIFLRPTAWTAFTDAVDDQVRRTMLSLIRIGEIADGVGNPSAALDDLLREQADGFIGASLETLYEARLGLQTSAAGPTWPATKAVGRNDPCPCGSGKKFKKCCLN